MHRRYARAEQNTGSRLKLIHGATCRGLKTAAALALSVVLVNSPTSHAEPATSAPTPPSPSAAPSLPYPKADLYLLAYNRVDPADYFIPGNYGVYFLTPSGLNCGIWVRGSFGCTGDIPGASPGVTHIAWFNGDTRVHYDWTAGLQYPPVQAVRVLPPQSYVIWNEATCVTMADTSTFCKNGGFHFMITPTQTWLNG